MTSGLEKRVEESTSPRAPRRRNLWKESLPEAETGVKDLTSTPPGLWKNPEAGGEQMDVWREVVHRGVPKLMKAPRSQDVARRMNLVGKVRASQNPLETVDSLSGNNDTALNREAKKWCTNILRNHSHFGVPAVG